MTEDWKEQPYRQLLLPFYFTTGRFSTRDILACGEEFKPYLSTFTFIWFYLPKEPPQSNRGVESFGVIRH
jgi:hypothetical protein